MSIFVCGQSYFNPQPWTNSGRTRMTNHFEPLVPRGGQLLRSDADFSQHEMISTLDLQHNHTRQTTAAPSIWRSSKGKLFISTKLSSLRLIETTANAFPPVVPTRHATMAAARLTKTLPDALPRVTCTRNTPMAAVRLTEPLVNVLPHKTHHRNVFGVTDHNRFLKDKSLVPPPTPTLKVPPPTPDIKVSPPTPDIKVSPPTPDIKVPLKPSDPFEKTIQLPKSDQLEEKGFLGRRRQSRNTIRSKADVNVPTVVGILTVVQSTDTKMSSSKPDHSQPFMTPVPPATRLPPAAIKKMRGYKLYKGSVEFPVYR